jgi:hypothetical protein
MLDSMFSFPKHMKYADVYAFWYVEWLGLYSIKLSTKTLIDIGLQQVNL